MTFKDIEDLLGVRLPPSARQPQWWANTTSMDAGHAQRRAWGEAGFDAFLVRGADSVRFAKVRSHA